VLTIREKRDPKVRGLEWELGGVGLEGILYIVESGRNRYDLYSEDTIGRRLPD
jgi:hypothetical protein